MPKIEIPEGYTPGPWWTAAKYDGREAGCAIIAARTDAGPLPGNPTRGMVAWASASLNTEARRCEANARLIALAPDLAARIAELEAEIASLAEDLEARVSDFPKNTCGDIDQAIRDISSVRSEADKLARTGDEFASQVDIALWDLPDTLDDLRGYNASLRESLMEALGSRKSVAAALRALAASEEAGE